MKRKRNPAQPVRHHHIPFDPSVPTNDFFADINLDDPGGIDEALDSLIQDIESGYFLEWEAVLTRCASKGVKAAFPQMIQEVENPAREQLLRK